MRKGELLPELIAPCGMNCGVCIAFFGFTLKGEKRKHPCFGCRARTSHCALIKKPCNKLKTKQVTYCFECVDFPCKNLRTLDKRYRSNFGMSMIENLNYIQKNGIDEFLRYEQERWKCPRCGEVICVHNKTCYSCGYIQSNV